MMYRQLVDTNPWKNEYLSVDPWKRLEADINEYKEYEDWDMIFRGELSEGKFSIMPLNFVYFNRDLIKKEIQLWTRLKWKNINKIVVHISPRSLPLICSPGIFYDLI